MYNKSGGKVRLTFKLEQDQLWIGTKGNVRLVPVYREAEGENVRGNHTKYWKTQGILDKYLFDIFSDI